MNDYSLLLNNNWDITLDSAGNIATTQKSYAIAQNVANAVRLFTEDAYFDWDRGIPHFAIELRANPQISTLRARIKEASLAVDGVEAVQVDLDPVDSTTRELSGVITLETTYTDTVSVEF